MHNGTLLWDPAFRKCHTVCARVRMRVCEAMTSVEVSSVELQRPNYCVRQCVSRKDTLMPMLVPEQDVMRKRSW